MVNHSLRTGYALFLRGGVLGVIVMACCLALILGIGIAQKKSVFPPVVLTIILPTWTAETSAYTHHIQSLAQTDELYAQCKTDMDACADMSILGNIGLLFDGALWFVVGGCITLVIGIVKKRQH